jgi:O-antigen/teichoic acid export membrane protein
LTQQSLTGLAWAWPLGSVVMVVVTLISVNPFKGTLTFNLHRVGELLRVLPSFSGVSLLSALEYQLDVILLSVLLTHTDVAVYSAAATIMAIVLIGAQAYRMVLYPKLVETLTHRPTATGRWVGYSIVGLGGLAALTALGIFFVAPVLIELIYGEHLLAAAPVLRVLIWNVVLVFITVPLVRLLVASNRQARVWQLLLISVGINVSANWMLIPALGPLGAAYARLLSSSLFCLLAAALVWRHWPPLPSKAMP